MSTIKNFIKFHPIIFTLITVGAFVLLLNITTIIINLITITSTAITLGVFLPITITTITIDVVFLLSIITILIIRKVK